MKHLNKFLDYALAIALVILAIVVIVFLAKVFITLIGGM